MLTRHLRLLVVLCVFAAFDAVAQTVVPSYTDLWDISQGSAVTADSGVNASGSDIRDMFGGTFSAVEPGHTVFADGQPAGFVHWVEWQTAVPVKVGSFNLFAVGDGAQYNNEREFAEFVLKAKSSALATNYDLTLYTYVVTNHPYTFLDPVNDCVLSTSITPVTAQYFRAEFTQYTAGRGYDGPRIIELDGFGTNPPVIVTQPASQNVAAGVNATFTVTVTGGAPLSYQWLMNGSNVLASATNATLVLTNVPLTFSGNQYSVLVSNIYGSTNSSSALLTVNPPFPSVLLPSTNDLWDVSQGSIVTADSGVVNVNTDIRDMFGGTFSYVQPGITIFGDGRPAGFVHYVEWQTIAPVSLSSFILFAVGDGPAYNNQREFSQFVLKAMSSPLATNYDLTLYTLVVTNHPYTFADPVNDALVAAYIPPVTAQYFRAEFTQYTASAYNNGPRIIELDGFGVNPPSFLSEPASQTVTVGMNADFSATVSGTAPFSYQWRENGTNISVAFNPTATNATLVLSNVQLNLSSNLYSVIITNINGFTNSSNATLVVIPQVFPSTNDLWDVSHGSVVTANSGLDGGSDVRDMFGGTFGTAEPGNTIFADGQPAGFVHYVNWQTPVPVQVDSFNLFASGDGAQYNDQREFAQFVLKAKSSALATNYDLTLYTLVVTNHPYSFVDPVNDAVVSTNITPVTAQYFRAEFTQYNAGFGFDGPRIIELDGFGPNLPVVVAEPVNQVVNAGANATFSVIVSGTAPFTYQWRENGTNIPAAMNDTATNALLVLYNVQTNLSGDQFSVHVTGVGGATNSSSATLTVINVHYVDRNSTNSVYPYTSWATAATNIQNAVDAAETGDEVLVTNGDYEFGGRPVPPCLLTNRVAVTNAITVQSVNGPALTIIQGYQVPGSTNGDSAVRCAYLTNGASLIGFSLVNGATLSSSPYPTDENGGGVCCGSTNESVSNCVISSNSAYNQGGGAYAGNLTGCILTGNSASPTQQAGGGAAFSLLESCSIAGNQGLDGGGAMSCVANQCTFTGNMAYAEGGAACQSTLTDCLLTDNQAASGAGVYGGTLINCLVASNSATLPAGVVGGAAGATLFNCTVTMNSGGVAGGAYACTLYNSIVYFNTGRFANFDAGSTLNYCCTTPLPSGGAGNIPNNPLFMNPAAGNFRLQPASPCVNAGNDAYVTTARDLDGNPRIAGDAVDLGAFELPVHYVDQNGVNPTPPYTNWATAAINIQDAVDIASNYDGILVTNGVYAFGGGDSAGNYSRVDITRPLTLESVNGPAVTIIQGNYVYDSSAARCVAMTDGDSLIGFTLTQGMVWDDSPGPPPPFDTGGGVFGWQGNSVVSNCLITGNNSFDAGGGAGCQGSYGPASMTVYNCTISSNIYGAEGGGAYGCTLYNCKLIGNAAPNSGFAFGGGAASCILMNCTIVSNSAPDFDYPILSSGGGAYYCMLSNCIVVDNTAWSGANFDETTGDVLNFCCTTPMPVNGTGNLTNDPMFLNPAVGDFHLSSNSPCINAGNNAYVVGTTDLGGNPRIAGGTVDIGAYEFQNPGSLISYAWLEQYGFATDGSADYTDTDGSGMNHWQDWVAGLDPTNPLSVLQMSSATNNGTNIVITWQSVTNINYFLQRASNLSVSPAFHPLASNILGQAGTTSYTDTNAPAPGPYFYRVGVQ